MADFMGMDTAEVDDFGGLLTERADSLRERFDSLSSLVDSIVGAQWVGSDADAFGQSFRGDVMSKVSSTLDGLDTRAKELTEHVQEQDTASTATGGVAEAIGDFFEGVGDFFAGVGDFFGEVWDNFVETIKPEPVDGAGGIISTVHSWAKRFGDVAWGKGAVPRFIPLIGDAFTGLMAGAERWNSEPDRPFWERLGRAALDGGANFAGSMAGSVIGGAIGAGAVTLVGAGIGAVTGSVPGALAGGGAGVIAGGVIGDVVGSYFGAAAGDAVIDAILD